MRKVITYGSFDMMHEGHIRLLKRAKALGDYLIVGVTTNHFDERRGKLNVIESHIKRCQNVERCGFADKVITEDHAGQKLEDIIKYGVDVFTVGSDWVGEFDYLKDYCEVVYLERTKNISSTQLRTQKYPLIRVGVVGTGRVVPRLMREIKYVSGIEVTCVYNPNTESANKFASQYSIDAVENFEDFLDKIDAVYVATPHETHYDYIVKSIKGGKHVLCEKPMALNKEQAQMAFDLAKNYNKILMESIKIAYAPGFVQMMGIIRSGVIGNIRDVEACFTKLPLTKQLRELRDAQYGGSFTELASYNLMAIIKLMGSRYNDVRFHSVRAENGVDIYTKAYFVYENGFATSKTGLGVKSDGQLLISGTQGYIIARSPWWLMQEFEVCFEDTRENRVYRTDFMGNGLRYELADFVSKINGYNEGSDKLTVDESIEIARIIGEFLKERV